MSRIKVRSLSSAIPHNVIKELNTVNAMTKQIYSKYSSFNGILYKTNGNTPHPLIFEVGHINNFYKTRVLNEPPSDLFDSMTNIPEHRKYHIYPKIEDQLDDLDRTIDRVIDLSKESKVNTYLSTVGLFHHHMHMEVPFFLSQTFLGPHPLISRDIFKCRGFTKPITWLPIEGGEFTQGTKDALWDNEEPCFTAKVKDFEMAKYPITQGEYIEFMDDGGYTNKALWSHRGWMWKELSNAKHPIYWERGELTWYRWDFDVRVPVEPDFPVCNISYWEAEAYAKWKGARLPTETEMEYALTNGGTTKWPWGDKFDDRCNMNYTGSQCSVYEYEKDSNKWGVHGLMGNIWQWTQTPFQPYDGFSIDPVYDTFSYPFFYDRFVVKGASWCSSSMVCYPSYRNAQERDSRHHYIGIRLVR